MEKNYEEDLYFGDKYAYLYPCTGIFRSYKKEYIHQDDINKESTAEALKYSDDLSYIKPEYKDHYVPVVPETVIHFKNENLKDDENENIDTILKQPLIKAKEIKDYPCLQCIVRGHRSAVIKDPKSGEYYRLKGCGNDELGFNLQKSELFIIEYSTRGSQFDSTCFRELYYSGLVDESLKKIGMRCANYPLGFWKYGKDLKILPKENIKEEDILMYTIINIVDFRENLIKTMRINPNYIEFGINQYIQYFSSLFNEGFKAKKEYEEMFTKIKKESIPSISKNMEKLKEVEKLDDDDKINMDEMEKNLKDFSEKIDEMEQRYEESINNFFSNFNCFFNLIKELKAAFGGQIY